MVMVQSDSFEISGNAHNAVKLYDSIVGREGGANDSTATTDRIRTKTTYSTSVLKQIKASIVIVTYFYGKICYTCTPSMPVLYNGPARR
jgi:hypothetical protein